MCKCMEKLRAQARQKTGDPEADLVNTMIREYEDKSRPNEEVPEPLIVEYRPKNDKGDFMEKEQTFISYIFCPFCGRKYL